MNRYCNIFKQSKATTFNLSGLPVLGIANRFNYSETQYYKKNSNVISQQIVCKRNPEIYRIIPAIESPSQVIKTAQAWPPVTVYTQRPFQ